MNDKNPDELGALWVKSNARGEFMTGTVGGVGVVVFRNDKKVPGSNQPEWRVMKARPASERPKTTHPVADDDIGF